MPHPLAMISREQHERVLGKARTAQRVVDQADLRVGHLSLAIAGVDVIAPVPFTPMTHAAALLCRQPGQVRIEVFGQRRQFALDRGSVVELSHASASATGVTAVVRIQEADRQEKRPLRSPVAQEGHSGSSDIAVANLSHPSAGMQVVETVRNIAAGNVPLSGVDRFVVAVPTQPLAQVGQFGIDWNGVGQHAMLKRGPTGKPAGPRRTADRLGCVSAAEGDAIRCQAVDCRRGAVARTVSGYSIRMHLIDVQEQNVRNSVLHRAKT